MVDAVYTIQALAIAISDSLEGSLVKLFSINYPNWCWHSTYCSVTWHPTIEIVFKCKKRPLREQVLVFQYKPLKAQINPIWSFRNPVLFVFDLPKNPYLQAVGGLVCSFRYLPIQIWWNGVMSWKKVGNYWHAGIKLGETLSLDVLVIYICNTLG